MFASTGGLQGPHLCKGERRRVEARVAVQLRPSSVPLPAVARRPPTGKEGAGVRRDVMPVAKARDDAERRAAANGKGRGVALPVSGFHLQASTLTWPMRFWTGTTGPSGFSPSSSCSDVLEGRDLRGTVVMVTGANTGLGREAARALVAAGGHVVAVGRSVERLAELVREAERLPGKVTPMACDLSDPRSVRRFAEEFLARREPLHCLVNNAGVAFTPPDARSVDGIELQFATNQLGTYFLTQLLLPRLKETGTATSMARVVNVSSCAHAGGVVPSLEQVLGNEAVESGLDPENMQLYYNSKLCNVLHARWLNERLVDEGAHVRVNSVHPGIIVQSEIWRNDALLRFSMGLLSATCKSADQGASTLVWAVVAQELEAQGGLHLVDCNVNETHPKGHDMAEAERLVALSEQLLDRVLGSTRPRQAASTGVRSTDGNL